MGDYHTVYKDMDGKTTEWDDLQVWPCMPWLTMYLVLAMPGRLP